MPECPFLRLPFAAVFLPPEALELVLLLFGSQLKLSELFLVRRLGLTTGTRSGDGDLEMAGAGNSAGCSLSLVSESLSVAWQRNIHDDNLLGIRRFFIICQEILSHCTNKHWEVHLLAKQSSGHSCPRTINLKEVCRIALGTVPTV